MKNGELAEEPHQHTFRIELELTSEKLDEAGCVVDFCDMDNRMADVLGSYTNMDLHEHQRFNGKSPSAEVMAEVIFTDIKSCIPDMPARLESVTVWEDNSHAGSFRRVQ